MEKSLGQAAFRLPRMGSRRDRAEDAIAGAVTAGKPLSASRGMSLINLRDVCKVYRLDETEVVALRDVCLGIEKGECVALMGPSGSGKSTLMNLLGCLDRPTSGSYRLDGREVGKMSRDARARLRNRQIGFVFQNFNLLARTGALENVELPLLYSRRISARQRHRQAIEVLERVGLGDRAGHHPGQLSGGEQQRVAIARALVNRPSILMADEPTGNLDSRTGREVIEILQKLHRESGITLILVTHDQNVARHAERWLVLKDGRLVADTADFDRARQALQSEDEEPDGA